MSNNEFLLQIVKTLNEAIAVDQTAISQLINYRVPCNPELSEHPSIQTVMMEIDKELKLFVGILGLLNGIAGPDALYWIIARVNGEKFVIEFDLISKTETRAIKT